MCRWLSLILPLVLLTLVSTQAGESRNGKIAFAVEYRPGLYVLNLDNREIERIDIGIESIEIRDLDYNERKDILAFEGGLHEGPSSLYIYDFSTKQICLFYEGTSLDNSRGGPTFHPDGERVFSTNYDNAVFEHEIATKRWRKVEITNTTESDFRWISFSKSGTNVALSSPKLDGFLIGEVDGSRIVVRKHILTDFNAAGHQWIGDAKIVFSGRKQGNRNRLWKVSLADESLAQLTPDPMDVSGWLSLSKDEKWVVFRGSGPEKTARWCLWRISVDGQGLEQLTKDATDFHGHLSPVWIE